MLLAAQSSRQASRLLHGSRHAPVPRAPHSISTQRSDGRIGLGRRPGPRPPRATPSSDTATPAPIVAPGGGRPGAAGPGMLRILYKKALKELSSLPRAIYTMASIAVLSGLGTIVEQNESVEYYQANYPEGAGEFLGVLNWKVLLALELNHIYTAWYFWALLAFLAASLTACTFTRQLPVAKVAQRWRFPTRPEGMIKEGRAEMLPNARVRDLGGILDKKGYQVFVKDGALYAFKGLAGRLGPIGVHAALLLIMAGTTASVVGGLKGTAMVPEGQAFEIGSALHPTGLVGINPSSAPDFLKVNSFSVDYRPNGAVAQFYSDLSVVDARGRELMRKQISVNKPLRYGGVTMYQTDWQLAGVNLRVVGAPGSQPAEARVALPMASLEGQEGVSGKLFASYLPIQPPTEANPTPKGISFLARDLQSVALYDSKGQFAGVRRPGSGKAITVDGVQLVVDGLVGATGLELKCDPGVPLVYTGFGALMITTIVSYLSHSQVWALQQGSSLYVAGRTNRATYMFNNELDDVLESVPELPPSSPSPTAAGQ